MVNSSTTYFRIYNEITSIKQIPLTNSVTLNKVQQIEGFLNIFKEPKFPGISQILAVKRRTKHPAFWNGRESKILTQGCWPLYQSSDKQKDKYGKNSQRLSENEKRSKSSVRRTLDCVVSSCLWFTTKFGPFGSRGSSTT